MKKIVLFFTFVSVLAGFSPLTAQTISLLSVSSASVCPGSTFDVTFNATGSYNSGNAFEVRLSDPTGSFATYTYLGSTTNSSGVINCTVPSSMNAGTAYSLEVVSNSPYVSSNVQSGFIINHLAPTPWVTVANPYISTLIGQSSSFTANAQGATQVNWNFGANSSNPIQTSVVTANSSTASSTFTSAGLQTISLTSTSTDGCVSNTYNKTYMVYDCSPIIPSNTNIISTNTSVTSYSSSNNYWVCGGSTLSFGNSVYLYNSTMFAENGSTIDLSGYYNTSPITIYLKTGAALILPPSSYQQQISVIKEVGASVSNLGTYSQYSNIPATVLTCTSGLTFDYTNVVPATTCITSPISNSGQSIAITSLSSAALCPGSTLNVNYTTSGSFGAGNLFLARLSNSSGSFATYSYIGSSTTAGSGTISCAIPSNLVAGTNYVIQVIATNPYVVSASSTSLSLGTMPSTPWVTVANPYISTLIGQSSSFTANAQGATQVNWNFGANSSNPIQTSAVTANSSTASSTFTSAGLQTISLTSTSTDGCVSNTYNKTYMVYDCSPIIPSNTNIISTNTSVTSYSSSNNYWVCGGSTLSFGNSVYLYNSTMFAENGSTIDLSGYYNTSPITIYLKTGAALILPPSSYQQQISVIKEVGASVSNLGTYSQYSNIPATVLTCTSGLTFDYTNVVPATTCITSPISNSGQSIAITSLSSAALCPGSTLNVNYTTSGSFGAGNLFLARLSNSSGSFATYSYIGSSTTAGSGTISCAIPSNLVAGTNYVIQVIATNPYVVSASSTSLSLGTMPSTPWVTVANPYISALIGQSSSFTANAQGATQVNWNFGANSSNPIQTSVVTANSSTASSTFTSAGLQTISLTSTSTDGCVSNTYNKTYMVYDCSPIIPSNTNIISTNTSVTSYSSSNNYWVCGGSTLSFGNSVYLYNSTMFAENGSTIDLSGYYNTSPITIYLKAGAALILPTSSYQQQISVIKEVGASVSNLGTYSQYSNIPATVLTCTSGLTFDHANFPCGTICYSPAVSASVVISSNSAQLCSSTSGVVLTATPNFNASSYEWYQVGNNTALQTGTSNTFTVSSTGDYYVKAIIVNSVGTCVSPSSNTINITSGSTSGVVVISASGSTTLCNGGNVTLSNNLTGSLSYVWFRNGISISGATTNSLTIGSTGLLNLAGNYYLQVSNANGCVWLSNTIAVNIGTLPVIIVTGPTNSCGSAITLTASGASTYVWSGGPSTASYTVNPSGTTTYTVTGTNAQGCSNSANYAVTSYPTCATSTLPCAQVYAKKALSISAVNVTGAIAYKFSFYDPANLITPATSFTQASRTLALSSVPNLYYNKTYVWTVAVDKGTGFGPESSKTCTMSILPPQTTVPCGLVKTNMISYTAATAIQGALAYRFTFVDASGTTTVAPKVQSTTNTTYGTPPNYIYFNQVPGLMYNKTYYWSVEVEYATETGTAWGPASSNSCTLTFGPAQSTVPCGLVKTNMISYTAAASVYGALAYRFTFVDAAGTTVVPPKIQSVTNSVYGTPPNYIYFNQVPGLMYNKTYYWSVEVQYATETGTAWGPASSNSCTLTFGPPESTVPCGLVKTNMISYTAAASVYGALAYRFTFVDAAGTTVVPPKIQSVTNSVYGTPPNYIYFNQVPGLMYNKTYYWSVEVQYATETGTAWGPASNNSCTLTFGPPESTVPCGLVKTNMISYTAAASVYGALAYRFTFVDAAGTVVVPPKIQSVTNSVYGTPPNYIYFNQVPGLMYNKTYYWSVEVQYATETGTAWGPASSNSCTLTFGPPQATVPCGSSFATLNTYTACTAVYAATRYKFNFFDATTNTLVAQKTQFSNYIYFNTVSSLQNNTNYYWTVEVEYATYTGNVWGPSSSPCLITFGTPSAKLSNTPITNETISIQEVENIDFFVNAFPNPTAGKVKIESNLPVNSIEVLSASGQLLFLSDSVEEIDLVGYEAGMYILKIITEKGIQHLRIIKE